MLDPCDPMLVLVAYGVGVVYTVVYITGRSTGARPRARTTIRLGTEAKAPADKEINQLGYR